MLATCTTSRFARLEAEGDLFQVGIAQVPADRRNDAIGRSNAGFVGVFLRQLAERIWICNGLRPTWSAFCGDVTAINRARTLAPNSDSKAFLDVSIGDFNFGGDKLASANMGHSTSRRYCSSPKPRSSRNSCSQRSRARPNHRPTLSISAETSASVTWIPFWRRHPRSVGD